MRIFDKRKLQPTSHYFEQLLQKDRQKFDGVYAELAQKKNKIDDIVARYNRALNFQSCEEQLGTYGGKRCFFNDI